MEDPPGPARGMEEQWGWVGGNGLEVGGLGLGREFRLDGGPIGTVMEVLKN